MKSNMLLLLTRPVRSPLHSSLVYPQRTLASALFRSLGRHQSEIVFGVLVVISAATVLPLWASARASAKYRS
jgi:hypothetical protein